jgi:hypothetical protein
MLPSTDTLPATSTVTPIPTVADTPLPTDTPLQTETATPEPEATETESPLPTATNEPSPTAQVPAWKADGIIMPDEYTYQDDFSGLRFWWSNDASFLYFAIEGDTTGWVAAGFDPDSRMQGANFLFGFVTSSEVKIWDAYGTGPTGPNHPPDEELGGTVDIVNYFGLEEDGMTRFEIQIPLDSGDAYDKSLEPGQTYPFIVAMGGEDEFNAYHLKYAVGQLNLDN